MTIVPDQEQLLETFRAWLAQVEDEARQTQHELRATEPVAPSYRELVEHFTALRHEVKLQTKSARQSQEQGDRLIAALGQAIVQLQAAELRLAEGEDTPEEVLDLLMNLDDALERGRGVVEQVCGRVAVDSPEDLELALDEEFAGQPWWRRWACRSFHRAARQLFRQQAEVHGALCDSLLEGYQLIQARFSRAMTQQQLERMDCVGRAADPSEMMVVEAVIDRSVRPGIVVEEVRRGYRWRDRVVRFAEVRAVALAGPGNIEDRPTTSSAISSEDQAIHQE